MKQDVLYLNAKRNGYLPDQCDDGNTMTVGDLIDLLEQYPDDERVFLKHDNGYTYGSIDFDDFEEDTYDFDGDEE